MALNDESKYEDVGSEDLLVTDFKLVSGKLHLMMVSPNGELLNFPSISLYAANHTLTQISHQQLLKLGEAIRDNELKEFDFSKVNVQCTYGWTDAQDQKTVESEAKRMFAYDDTLEDDDEEEYEEEEEDYLSLIKNNAKDEDSFAEDLQGYLNLSLVNGKGAAYRLKNVPLLGSSMWEKVIIYHAKSLADKDSSTTFDDLKNSFKFKVTGLEIMELENDESMDDFFNI